MRQQAQISATCLLRGNHRISRWGLIGRPMCGVQIEGQAGLGRLTCQLDEAVFLTRLVPILGRCAARPAKQRDDIQRLVSDLSAMFRRNLLQSLPGEV